MDKPPQRTSRPIPPPEIIQTESTSSKHTRLISKNRQMDDPRLKARPPEPPEPAPRVSKRVPKVKSTDKVRIESLKFPKQKYKAFNFTVKGKG